MQTVVPTFMRHAAAFEAERDHGSDSDTKTKVAGRGHLTLDFRDNPFESLVRQLEKLIERDPKEALRLLKLTLSSKLFHAPCELQRLGDKLNETLEKLRDSKPNPALPAAALTPALSTAFTRESFGLPLSAPVSRPAPQPANSNRPDAMPGADLSSLAA